MHRSAAELRRDALRIWQAGVDAVRSQRLVQQCFRVDGDAIVFGPQNAGWDKRSEVPPSITTEPGRWDCASLVPPYCPPYRPPYTLPLDSIRRIVVVGAGKAGAGMAEAVEEVLGPTLMAEKQLAGWVNVPADCVRPLQRIHLHAARAAGVNEPAPEGVAGAREILRLVESLGPDDLCLCLISGGGSALMPAPVEGITLADKLAVTRHLSAAGANIEQLNTVRKQLSRIKGGGLLRACRAGRLVSLVISDVLGDPLDVIASGPTVPDSSTPQAALEVLHQFAARAAGISPAVFDYLEAGGTSRGLLAPGYCANFVIGNNATAVAAAGEEAQRLGYTVVAESASRSEGPAEEIGCQLADRALEMRCGAGVSPASSKAGETPAPQGLISPTCLVSGGEPVVKLVESSRRGMGGRNQQLVLAALLRLLDDGAAGIALLSGGTDGEDGPTDAAGAYLDAEVLAAAKRLKLDPSDFLARNDAYHFFAPLDALVKTGPTHTNVCDVRVVLAQ
jgi:hydroxypyruvate reductase